MKKRMFGLVLFITISFVNAQDVKFGKISEEELQEKYNPLDSSASATYLYKYRKTFFKYIQSEGFQLVTDVHEIIKVYNKEGFTYATKSVSLYNYRGESEKISGLKAYTYNLNNGKIEETKLKKEAIFRTERTENWNETKFTMPNIKEGSVIEYKYKISSPFFWNVDEYIFQHDIPIKVLFAKFETPEYYNFRVNTKGFLTVIPKIEKKSDKITFRNKTRARGGLTSGAVKTTYSTSDLRFTKNITTYKLTNIPALRDESHVNNINNYRSAVKYELQSRKLPNSIPEYYATTWEDVVKKIYKNPNFGAELNKSSYYKDDLEVLLASVSDPVKKIALIYNFVKSKVKWNGNYSKYTRDGVRKAYKNQVGNVAEINLMLTSMLRFAGLDANPVLISTRGNGIPLFPTREGYNYVVACIKLNDKMILLDATSKFATPNILPIRVLNWEGRIIKKNGSSTTINLYPNQKSKSILTMLVNVLENGDVEGRYRSKNTNHNALKYRNSYNESNQDDFIENLENNQDGLEISDFKVANANDLNKPVVESYRFIIENQVDVIGDNIYFSPLFFLRTIENPFKLEKREFPIDFGYPSSEVYRITINLPEGYKVESYPESKAIKLPKNLGFFSYTITTNEATVQIIVKSEINQPIVSPIYYDALKEYFKQLIEKEAEKVVLIRR